MKIKRIMVAAVLAVIGMSAPPAWADSPPGTPATTQSWTDLETMPPEIAQANPVMPPGFSTVVDIDWLAKRDDLRWEENWRRWEETNRQLSELRSELAAWKSAVILALGAALAVALLWRRSEED